MAFKVNAEDVLVYFEDDPEPVSLIDILAVITDRLEALEDAKEKGPE